MVITFFLIVAWVIAIVLTGTQLLLFREPSFMAPKYLFVWLISVAFVIAYYVS